MSDRKAELERKRKRLEEIKKAREEKKKVRNVMVGTISLIQYLTSWIRGGQLTDFNNWIETVLVFVSGCMSAIGAMLEKLILSLGMDIWGIFYVKIRKISVTCKYRLDGPVASLTLSRYMYMYV